MGIVDSNGWWHAPAFFVSVISTLAVAFPVLMIFADEFQIPRSVLLLDWGVTVLLIGGLKSVGRLFREHLMPSFSDGSDRQCLLIGAAPGGEAIVRHIHVSSRLNYRVVGYLDEDTTLHGSELGGIPFLGSVSDAVDVCQNLKVRHILLMDCTIDGSLVRTLMHSCREAEIELKILPSIDAILSDTYRLDVRDVDIEDLLQRDPVQLDMASVSRMVTRRRVLVTGAGGSIGSEICRQIVNTSPSELVLVERAENNLFHLDLELRRLRPDAELHPVIADVGDEARMKAIFERFSSELVFHAAAHKHVPMMEYNPGEAIKNNVLGTRILVDLSRQ